MSYSDIDFDKIVNQKLELSDDLSYFCCDLDDDLECNEFIHAESEAKLYQKERYGITYLFYYENDIVGYVTLAMSSFSAKRLEGRFKKEVRLMNYPSLLIGRLGVSNDYRKKGIGMYLCTWCVGVAISLSEKIGCRYVTLETSKGEREAFYEKCHFQKAKELEDDRGKHVWMFLKTDIT